MGLWAKKGLASRARTSLSSSQATALKRAMIDIEHNSIESLERTGKVKRLNTKNHENIYVYRARNARVLFSRNEQGNVVHDIIDTQSGLSLANRVKIL